MVKLNECVNIRKLFFRSSGHDNFFWKKRNFSVPFRSARLLQRFAIRLLGTFPQKKHADFLVKAGTNNGIFFQSTRFRAKLFYESPSGTTNTSLLAIRKCLPCRTISAGKSERFSTSTETDETATRNKCSRKRTLKENPFHCSGK